MAFAPDGRTLAAAAMAMTTRERCWLWDLADPADAAPIGEPLTGHSSAGGLGGVRSGRANPGHRRRDDGTVLLWDLADRPNRAASVSR